MTGKRMRYTAEFKAKVALEALRGELTTAQLAAKHGIHQTMVGEWKRQAMEGLTAVFSGEAAAQGSAKAAEADLEKPHAKIGQLVVERDFLAEASGRWASIGGAGRSSRTIPSCRWCGSASWSRPAGRGSTTSLPGRRR